MKVIAKILLASAVAFVAVPTLAQSTKRILKTSNKAFFETAEARQIGDQLLLFQRETGGWPKNIDMVTPLDSASRIEVIAEKSRRDDSTIDNDATTMQMTYLARLYRATGDTIYRDSFRRGIEYLLSGQYDNGGWPQFWPEKRDYQWHVTFNDNAMVNTMKLFDRVARSEAPYGGDLVDDACRELLAASFDKGVECILATQLTFDGKPAVWCQQYFHLTLAPAKARAYELPSFASSESVEIVKLLMNVKNPDKRIIAAVDGAMEWFDKYKIEGYRLERIGNSEDPDRDVRLVADSTADPLWARYYDLVRCEPFVCDRDGIMRRNLGEIGVERRYGYAWYSDRPAELFHLYAQWKKKHKHK